MMVSNRLQNIPAQVVCTEDVDLEATTIPELQTINGLLTTTKQTVSIVELGRRLRKCARLGNTEQVHELMTKGAPFTTDWLGTSALHLAAMNNHLGTCEVLLRAGISRDARTKVERTPLHLAAYEGHATICELLLMNKAEVDPRDMLRMTPLHWAVEKQHDSVVELLLQHGANPTLLSKFDKTPISIALELNRLDLAHLLQIAARLLAEQAELANNEESVEDAQATLIATQNLDAEFQHQVDVAQMEVMQVLPNQLKTEIIDDMTTNGNIEGTENETNHDFNEQIAEEPQILKNASAITSPSQLSTLQLLQEHGITMLPTDEGSLVNNAIQSGRTIVLSEAGKLVLAENKKIVESKPSIPIIKPVKKPILNPTNSLKNKKVITLTQEQFMAITKSQGNKPLLKKVSAEAFKKAAETAGIKYSMIPPLKTTPVISYSNSKLKKLTVISTKDQNKSPVKVLNPAAISNIIGSTNSTANIVSNNNVKLNETETYKIQLKDALAEIEILKAALNEKELENIKLKHQLEELMSKENPSVD